MPNVTLKTTVSEIAKVNDLVGRRQKAKADLDEFLHAIHGSDYSHVSVSFLAKNTEGLRDPYRYIRGASTLSIDYAEGAVDIADIIETVFAGRVAHIDHDLAVLGVEVTDLED